MKIWEIVSWVDALNAVAFALVIYIGIKKGLAVEFFRFLGVLLAVFVAFHFYYGLAYFIQYDFLSIPPEIYFALAFVILWLACVVFFKLICDGLFTLFVIEAKPAVDRWGGVAISVVRGILTCSLLTFVLVLSNIPIVENVPQTTFAKRFLIHLAPRTYQFFFEGLIVKFFPQEQLNQHAFQVLSPKTDKEESPVDKE